MGALLQRRRLGATWGSSSGEGGGGKSRWLCLEKSLDWVRLKLLMVMMMVVLMLLLMMVKVVMVVVMLQWHPVVTQPIFRGFRHGLKHPTNPSLSLHELLDGRAVLRLALLLLLSIL